MDLWNLAFVTGNRGESLLCDGGVYLLLLAGSDVSQERDQFVRRKLKPIKLKEGTVSVRCYSRSVWIMLYRRAVDSLYL